MLKPLCASVLTVAVASTALSQFRIEPHVALRKGDRICLLGSALAERMQHDGWLETRLQQRFPELGLTFRNLGYGADEVTVNQRIMNFGKFSDDARTMDLPKDLFVPWDRYLSHCKASVVFAFFGYNESFAGAAGIDKFKADLTRFVDHVTGRKYDGRTAPRLVLFSSIPFEDLHDPSLPSGKEHNARIQLYTNAMADVAKAKKVVFVDLYTAMKARYAAREEPLTINGIHLNSSGNQQVADVIVRALFGPPIGVTKASPDLRDAILEKNLLWYKRYRVNDGYNVYGGRSKIKYPRTPNHPDAVSNFKVLQRELDRLDIMVANRERRVAALANGRDLVVHDDHLPPPVPVKTNRPGEGPGGSHLYLDGEAAIKLMKPAHGMKVELFADEKRFPDLVNPVQMSFDTKGRLWVAVWPGYPNWKPGTPMRDKLLIFEDTDGDGRADETKVFAGDLVNPTGFEFWNGGVLVAQIPDIVFLKDSDGDDRYDVKVRMLHGISSGDTHHSANSFVLGPGGGLYFQEGTFHQTQIESIYGPVRNHNACCWRFDPRTWRVERYIPYNFANPHGHVFDRWGQDFITDGTGNQNYYALPFSGWIKHPAKHPGYFTFYRQRSRPSPGTEILSSRQFPPELQGNYLNANVIGFLGIYQEQFTDAGSGFGAEHVESIVSSKDPNFRPSDMEVGPDGALYFLDWHNAIIGHLQHHIRDPSRDHKHGRVYRVTCEGRPLLEPAAIDGRPIAELLDLLKLPEDRVRCRVRIELSERDSDLVAAAVKSWYERLDPNDAGYEHDLLEALWVYQQHDRMNRDLLERVLRAKDARARAAATRVLRYMRHRIDGALDLLRVQANDAHPRVRLEAVVAASFFDSFEATSVALEALKRPTDRFLDYALNETVRALEPRWKAGLAAGKPIAPGNPRGVEFLLGRVSKSELLQLPRIPAVLHALLARAHIDAADRLAAATALANENGTSVGREILAAIRSVDGGNDAMAGHTLHDLGALLQDLGTPALVPLRAELATLAEKGQRAGTRELGYCALITVDASGTPAWSIASRSRAGVEAFLGGSALVGNADLRAALFDRIRPLMYALPTELRSSAGAPVAEPGLSVGFYEPAPKNATLATFAKLKPSKIVRSPNITDRLDVAKRSDSFGLMFRGRIRVAKKGRYAFYLKSDDGSRLYVGDKQVIDNDGRHGVVQKRGAIRLEPGSHPIMVTYFDSGGGNHLSIEWRGPGFRKRPIPDDALGADESASTRAAAIRAMARVPGHAAQKFADAAKFFADAGLVDATVAMLSAVPEDRWPESGIRPVVDTIAAHVAGLPAAERTTPAVVAALDLGRRLAGKLPAAEAETARKTLAGLGGTIVLVRTIPHQMLYDVSEFWVEAGKPVAVLFQNNDMMPHNFVVAQPGTLAKVGRAAARTVAPHIPKVPEVLWHTDLLYPGKSARLTFVAPSQTGDYPFVCTFPGHWTVMNGIMHVVDTVDPDRQVTRRAVVEAVPVRPFVKEWTLADFDGAFAAGWERGRSAKRGHNLFTEAGCIKCHNFAGNGATGGPELTEIGKKYDAQKVLEQILDPSASILEGYEQHWIERKDDEDVIGRVLKDTGKALHVIETLQQPDRITVVPKDQIKDDTKMETSAMPTGLLVTLKKEEILDLVHWLWSKAH